MDLIESCVELPVAQTPLLLAVSGGCDSMVLLDCLRRAHAWPLHVFHLDHQIRDDSAADAALVRDYCEQHRITAWIEFCDIPDLAKKQKQGIEECARHYRYQRLQALATEHHIPYLLTAHHQDDQVETILLHMFRGAAAHGLSGMRSKRALDQGFLIRPFLQVSREVIEAYAHEQALLWREDSTNTDIQYRRNYLRHEIIPQRMRENPLFKQELLSAAAEQRLQLNELEIQLDEHWNQCLHESSIAFDYVMQWSFELRMVFWRRLLLYMQVPLSQKNLYRCESLLAGAVSKRIEFATWSIVKNDTAIAWYQEQQADLTTVLLPIGESVTHAGCQFNCKHVDQFDVRTLGDDQAVINPRSIVGDLHIRTIAAGERWQALGAPGSKSVFSFLSDKKYPIQKRAHVLVLADELGVLWIPGFTIAERARVKDEPALLVSCIKKHGA